MIIKHMRIKEGMFERLIDFSDKVNLVHSEQNSKGKTTLLRFLLYSLGYSIPSTRKIHFARCEVETKISSELLGEVRLLRNSNDYIVATLNENQTTFVLPDQLSDLHTLLFGVDNTNILNNLLGAFYVDQEKGWTLLNRGVVIGSIHFNIEELIRGLSNRDCTSLIIDEMKLSKNLEKYRQMNSVAKYQESLAQESRTLSADTYNEKSDIEFNQLLMRKNIWKSELVRIDRAISDNKQFKKYIAKIKLLIQLPDGNTLPVTEDNIFGLNDNMEYLIAKRKLFAAEMSRIANQINDLQEDNLFENQQLAFYNSETLVESFDRNLGNMPINAKAILREISRLEAALSSIRKKISNRTRIDNDVVTSLYSHVLKYAIELGIGDKESMTASYIFTSNLKELSGAVLHKTVFAFRLAYIIEIEKVLRIKLPIILDSPSGKEIDQKNIQLMVDILKRDFADNQIIIASIFQYNFDKVNSIEIFDKLIEPD